MPTATVWQDCAIIPSCFYYQPIRKIDFISASGKKQKINEILQEKEEHQEEPQEFYPLYIHLTYHDLIEVCEAISLDFTEKVKLMVQIQAGRVMSSCMKSVIQPTLHRAW